MDEVDGGPYSIGYGMFQGRTLVVGNVQQSIVELEIFAITLLPFRYNLFYLIG